MAKKATKAEKERAFGRYALAVLMETGPDASDRLADLVRVAVRMRLACENVQAGEATDPWVVPFPPGSMEPAQGGA